MMSVDEQTFSRERWTILYIDSTRLNSQRQTISKFGCKPPSELGPGFLIVVPETGHEGFESNLEDEHLAHDSGPSILTRPEDE